MNKRRQTRIKMVLPVRISAKDRSDNQFDELAHTLDITNSGARLGAIHHPFKPGDTLVYRAEVLSLNETGGKVKAEAARGATAVTTTEMVFAFKETDDPQMEEKRARLMKIWRSEP